MENDPEKGFAMLFEAYYAFVFKVVKRFIPNQAIAEDLAQDVFVNLFEKRKDLKIQKNLKGYLRVASRNKALNYLSQQNFNIVDIDGQHGLKSNFLGGSEKIELSEFSQALNQCINNLPDRRHTAFILSRFEGYSYREIAEELDISIKTVEHHISAALKSIRSCLGPKWLKCLLLAFSIFFL